MAISCSGENFSGSFCPAGVLRCLQMCCALLWVVAHSEEFSFLISLDLSSVLFCFCVLKIVGLPVFPWAAIYQPLLSVCLCYFSVSAIPLTKAEAGLYFLKPELVFLCLFQGWVTKITTSLPPVSSHVSVFNSLLSPAFIFFWSLIRLTYSSVY